MRGSQSAVQLARRAGRGTSGIRSLRAAPEGEIGCGRGRTWPRASPPRYGIRRNSPRDFRGAHRPLGDNSRTLLVSRHNVHWRGKRRIARSCVRPEAGSSCQSDRSESDANFRRCGSCCIAPPAAHGAARRCGDSPRRRSTHLGIFGQQDGTRRTSHVREPRAKDSP